LHDDLSHLADEQIMRRVQAGQSGLFAELVRRYQGALVRVARSRLARISGAEDVVQETFLAAYKSRHTYRDEFSFRTWLWTILLNQCRAHQQRMARGPQTHGASASDEASSPEAQLDLGQPLPLAQLLASERRQLLESLLGRLSTVQADALRLRFFGGLKFQEIAAAMDCSLGTAKNRVQGGLLQLSQLLHSETSYQSLADDWLAPADESSRNAP
jgi:RNA polymerase sigma-70 factor (ECF subfamily)